MTTSKAYKREKTLRNELEAYADGVFIKLEILMPDGDRCIVHGNFLSSNFTHADAKALAKVMIQNGGGTQ